ncbi:hypothetical protein FVE85_5288 [Porphyridium purpureum]|uniref:Uncharacterized protein n=1 Tax=Porphyridium purpureum TaxID=35688 RepID=A0A5J4Z414_PORPP|nr:hypothetical protein FVE85_5288 [Porphyridium purpureum]|eukprot:POR9303..scf295_1
MVVGWRYEWLKLRKKVARAAECAGAYMHGVVGAVALAYLVWTLVACSRTAVRINDQAWDAPEHAQPGHVPHHRMKHGSFRLEENELGNVFCVLQPILSDRQEVWTEQNMREHSGIRLFLRSFLGELSSEDADSYQFHVYYGHDADDTVFGSHATRDLYDRIAQQEILSAAVRPRLSLHYVPLYDLHGRINAIWNEIADVAFHDGCDYFFLSNDDMGFKTKGWVSRAVARLQQPRGLPQCRFFGIVRFKDEWAEWATFTFHVSTRLHMEVMDGIYYPVPFKTTHNDYWIYRVYFAWKADGYEPSIRMRNRMLASINASGTAGADTRSISEARYKYDNKSEVWHWILKGRGAVTKWLASNHRSRPFCDPVHGGTAQRSSKKRSEA